MTAARGCWRKSAEMMAARASRLSTRAGLVAKRGSVARAGCPSTCSQKRTHSGRRLDGDDDVAIGAGVGGVGLDGGMGEAVAAGLAAEVFEVQQRHRHPVGERVEHGDFDGGALPGAAAGDEGLEDRGMGVHAGGDVGDRDADAGHAFGRAGDAGEAAFGLDQHVIGAHRGGRRVLAIAADVDGDEARVAGGGRRGIEAETGGGAGGEVLDEDVGAGEHGFEQRAVGGVLEVERGAFLAAVEPGEIGRGAVDGGVVMAGGVAARRARS